MSESCHLLYIGSYKMKSIFAASVNDNSQGLAWRSRELMLLKRDSSCKKQPFNDSDAAYMTTTPLASCPKIRTLLKGLTS